MVTFYRVVKIEWKYVTVAYKVRDAKQSCIIWKRGKDLKNIIFSLVKDAGYNFPGNSEQNRKKY